MQLKCYLKSACALTAAAFFSVTGSTLRAEAVSVPEKNVITQDCVILLHGLSRSSASMKKMERHLQKAGFHVVNQGYPSRKNSIEALSEETVSNAITQCSAAASINFVTHSMGGILVRNYLVNNELPRLRHVVMLGPPNQGSEVVDKLGKLKMFKWINGPAGGQLGTDSDSLPKQLGSADFSLGVIAGSRSINPILSIMIPGRDDGKVSIENTKLNGMTEHLTMPVTHPMMMKNRGVMESVSRYLKTGSFEAEIQSSL